MFDSLLRAAPDSIARQKNRDGKGSYAVVLNLIWSLWFFGDLMYGADPTISARLGLTRQWLHARQLSFAHPRTGEQVTVTSEYPQDLRYALEVLESGQA